jgi:hemolysin activation/secretion protein
LYRYYSFALTIPQSENLAESTGSSDDEFEEMGEAMAQLLVQSISLSWGIRLPGNIIETNADSISGNLAIWEFDLMSLEEGRTLKVESRELNKVFVALFISVGAAILLLLGILVVLKARRQKASQVSAG